MIESWKWLTIHGIGTSYKVSAFKFSAENLQVLQHAGFGTKAPFHPYIGIIVWGPDTKIVIENPHGSARYAIEKAGLDDCCVLEKGIQKILDDYDKIENGKNIEVGRERPSLFWTTVTDAWTW